MSLIVLYFLDSTLVLSFYTDVVLTLYFIRLHHREVTITKITWGGGGGGFAYGLCIFGVKLKLY